MTGVSMGEYEKSVLESIILQLHGIWNLLCHSYNLKRSIPPWALVNIVNSSSMYHYFR